MSSSAYDASAELWPQLFGGLPDGERQRVLAGMRATRPRLVKGFEAMVRCGLETRRGTATLVAHTALRPCLPPALPTAPDIRGSAATRCSLCINAAVLAHVPLQAMARLILEDGGWGTLCGGAGVERAGRALHPRHRALHAATVTPPPFSPTACSNVERILADWDALLPASLAAWGEGEERLAAAFEAHRSALMAGAAERWQALNPLVGGNGAMR